MKSTLVTAMMRGSLLLLLIASVTMAQRTRPGTDVGGSEAAYVHATILSRQIVFYAIYNADTLDIRNYALWNDAESTVTLHLELISGDPIDLTAEPGMRAAATVVGRGYTLAPGDPPTDNSIMRMEFIHDQPVRLEDRDRTFPLPDRVTPR